MILVEIKISKEKSLKFKLTYYLFVFFTDRLYVSSCITSLLPAGVVCLDVGRGSVSLRYGDHCI